MNLSEKYRIVEDDNNVVLQFFERRTRNKKDGTSEEYEYTDDLFYPTLKTALLSFTHKELKYSKSIDEVLERINRIEKTIETITNGR